MKKKSRLAAELERADHELEKYLQNNQETRAKLTNMIRGTKRGFRDSTVTIYEGESHVGEFERTIPRDG